MDGLHGQFSGRDEPDSGLAGRDDAGASAPAANIGSDERRMQVRAYNFWASLLGDRAFPLIADLRPESLPDFGPRSVLLDFTDGIDNPAIAWLGGVLAEECEAEGPIRRLADVPGGSLLSRITDHYLQILANEAPIGFEAEFVNRHGATILYRGILLPFSRDGTTIDFIYGVINWKEGAPSAPRPAVEDEARPAMLRAALPLTDWADGPASLGSMEAGFDADAFARSGLYGTRELPRPGFAMFDDVAQDGPDMDLPFAEPQAGDMGLADWLASARELALLAQGSEDRSRQALYDAIGRAYDFAIAAMAEPEDFAELVEDAGLKVQERAPLIPLVKLVFGADYDKTRLTEFATVIAHAHRIALERGCLAGHLAAAPGGIKAVVREERRLRQEEAGKAAPKSAREKLVCGLRAIEAQSLATLPREGEEFTVLVARRLESGEVVVLGEVSGDEALLERAARHLVH